MEQEFQLCNVTSPIMKYHILLTNLPSELLLSATLSIMTTTHTTSSKKRSCNEWLLARRTHEVPSSYPRLWTDACSQNFSGTPLTEPTQTRLRQPMFVAYPPTAIQPFLLTLELPIELPVQTTARVGSNRHSNCNPGLSSGPGRRTHGKCSSVLLP